MLRDYTFKLYVLIILITITANGAYLVSTNGDILTPSISMDNNGQFLVLYKDLNNSTFKGEPSYIAEVQASSNRVNTNDNFSMDIFFSGAGDVDFAKMRVNIPKYIVKDEYIKLDGISFNFTPAESGRINLSIFKTTTNLEPAFDLDIPDIYFNLRDIKGFQNWGETAVDFDEAALRGANNPPYKISFKIAPNAPSGDHNIYLKLFYKSNGRWYSDTQQVPVHINSWYENENWQYVIIFSLVISIMLQLISAIPIIKKMLEKSMGKEK